MTSTLRPAAFVTTILATALFVALAFAGCTQIGPSSAPASSSSAGSSDEVVTVGNEGVYFIELDYNAGTGYEWVCTVEPEGVFSIVDQVTLDASDTDEPISGGPLTDSVMLRATGAGKATLTCELVRPWEEDAEPAEVQTYTFDVADDLRMVFVPDESNFVNLPILGSNS